MPEQIKLHMEDSLAKEIPETTHQMRQATQIPLKYAIDKA